MLIHRQNSYALRGKRRPGLLKLRAVGPVSKVTKTVFICIPGSIYPTEHFACLRLRFWVGYFRLSITIFFRSGCASICVTCPPSTRCTCCRIAHVTLRRKYFATNIRTPFIPLRWSVCSRNPWKTDVFRTLCGFCWIALCLYIKFRIFFQDIPTAGALAIFYVCIYRKP
jgi:hypothetical protein